MIYDIAVRIFLKVDGNSLFWLLALKCLVSPHIFIGSLYSFR